MILALYTVDCFALLAMTRDSVHKNFIVMLSEAKHLLASMLFRFSLVIIFIYDSMLGFFLQGGQGA